MVPESFTDDNVFQDDWSQKEDVQEKPKSENAQQPQCSEDKKRAIVAALKHFGMI